jgi:TIR domain
LVQPSQEFDFFIGHSARDIKAAEKLYSYLMDRAKVFLDSKSLRLGRSWDLAVRDAQSNSAITVILVSKATDKAFYQREEIARAIAHSREQPSHHTVIPVFLDKIPELSSSLPYGLVTLHGLSISRSFTLVDAADKLMEELSQVSEENETPAQLANEAEIRERYSVDLCLCIDSGPAAESFTEGIIGESLKFPYLLMGQMSAQYENIGQLRVRILTFGADVNFASMRDSETEFLIYPRDTVIAAAHAQKMLHRSQPAIQSRTLIALEKAIRSHWCDMRGRVLHLIALWSASPLQSDKAALDRLRELWDDHESTGLSPAGKRLVIFAPKSDVWEYISSSFSNAIWRVGPPGRTEPSEFDNIMQAITKELRPEEDGHESPVKLSVNCISIAVDARELQIQARAGSQQQLTDHRPWTTGRQLLAEARRSGDRMPIIFSGSGDHGHLMYWAVIDDIAIDDHMRTTCLYSDLREINPPRQRSELRLRKSKRQLSTNTARSHVICLTPGFIVQEQSPNAV